MALANQNTPFGLAPKRFINGMNYNGGARLYQIPAAVTNAIFVGDPIIKTAGTADANGIPGCNLASAGAGDLITGVVVGFLPVPAWLGTPGPIYRSSGTKAAAVYIYVCDDPLVLFEIQENDNVGGTPGTPLAVATVGKNANLASGTGSTTTGLSGWMLECNGAATTQNFQLSIIEFVQGPTYVAASLYGKVLVRINQHTEVPNSLGI
jgi:hypothetical protein